MSPITSSNDTPWLTWTLVACGVLAVIAVLSRVIWGIQRRRSRDTRPVPQERALASSSWPSRPSWHDEEVGLDSLEKDAQWMSDKSRRRDTTPLPQKRAFVSSSWPSRPWHDEEVGLEKDAPWMSSR